MDASIFGSNSKDTQRPELMPLQREREKSSTLKGCFMSWPHKLLALAEEKTIENTLMTERHAICKHHSLSLSLGQWYANKKTIKVHTTLHIHYYALSVHNGTFFKNIYRIINIQHLAPKSP